MDWPEGTEPQVEIETDVPVDDEACARVVTWLPWDSGFRGAGLAVGDLIVGHQTVMYGPAERAAELRIGEARFGEWLRSEGLRPGKPFTVHVLRNGAPLRIEGTVGAMRRYTNANGQRTLGTNGPACTGKDGFNSPWESWYGEFVATARNALAGWDQVVGISSRRLLADVDSFAARVEFLQIQHPGAFSRAALHDLSEMRRRADGEVRELRPSDVSYRELGAIRAEAVTRSADAAFAAFLDEMAPVLRTDLPAAPNSFDDDVSSLIGAMVRLPPLGRRQTLYETQRSWCWSGSNGGGYLIDRASATMELLHVATRAYVEMVDPTLRESSVTFIGVIQPEPALVVDVDRQITVAGLRVETVAALVSSDTVADHRFFADLRADRRTEAFAGLTATAAGIARPPLADTSTPAEVLLAAFDALKRGDMATWLSCYATWNVTTYFERDGSYQWVDLGWSTISERSGASDWDRARQRLHTDVFGVEVARVGPVRVVYDAAQSNGDREAVIIGPRIVEEVTARVNHIGYFEGEYRTFSASLLHRRWRLQRVDHGPWRIIDPQSL
ncbi:MAG: hypothetical protein H7Z40_08435 [Phycisphaerae bacterium]|nr:hypothetical protein [Gemmatimonadaceae bacterium]